MVLKIILFPILINIIIGIIIIIVVVVVVVVLRSFNNNNPKLFDIIPGIEIRPTKVCEQEKAPYIK